MKRKVLGLLLFLSIVPFFMGCDQETTTVAETSEVTTTEATTSTTVATLGLVTIEIYAAGDDPATTDVTETEYVSTTVEVSYYEGDTLFDLLDANFTMVIETASFGRYIVSIDSIVPGDSEYVSFYINGEYAMTGMDDTPLTDGDVYQFKLGSF